MSFTLHARADKAATVKAALEARRDAYLEGMGLPTNPGKDSDTDAAVRAEVTDLVAAAVKALTAAARELPPPPQGGAWMLSVAGAHDQAGRPALSLSISSV